MPSLAIRSRTGVACAFDPRHAMGCLQQYQGAGWLPHIRAADAALVVHGTNRSRVSELLRTGKFEMANKCAAASSNSHTSNARAKNFGVPPKGEKGSAQHRQNQRSPTQSPFCHWTPTPSHAINPSTSLFVTLMSFRHFDTVFAKRTTATAT